jgi:arylsulfatase A-like enzyme
LALTLPNIQAISKNGVRFSHAYVPAPVCAPSRACLASGREYDQAGVPNNFHNDYDIGIPTFYT